MFFLRSKRARRVTACTALALSAGMLLTGTASADTPAPRPSVKKVERSFTPPQLTHPKKDSARAGAAAAGTAAALPLSDLDGDFYDDIIFRSIDGELHSNASDDVFDLYRYDDVAKDIIPIGDQGGYDSHPEVLVLSENGTLTLYADAETTGTPYAYVVGGGWQVYNKIVSPGDVNNDGLADVVARTKDGQLYLYLATGDLERPLGGRILIGGGWGVYDQLVGAGDVTGDGQADLYARDTAGNLYFYSGTGNTSTPFSGSKRIGGGWGVYNQIVNFGEATLLARTNAGTFYTYYVEANGTLAAPQQHGNEGDGIGIAQLAGGGSNPHTGKDTVVGRDSSGTLYGYFAMTNGQLSPRYEASGPGEYDGIDFVNTSSFNSDNFSDIAEIWDWNNGQLWIGTSPIGNGWGVYNALVGPGDLSGDGKADLLARDRSGVLYLYKGNGQGTAFAGRIRVGGGWGGFNELLGAGDYTGDGRADLLARTTGGELFLYPGSGNATTPFKARVSIGSGWNTYKHLTAPGDLNADGKADVLGVTSTGDLYRYLNTSPSKFSTRVKIGHGFQVYNSMS
ncbi:VCBS repeat-containing protein [Streptomyces sp. NBC_01255]|uniref:FG-GAP repeat domain-containing protein n=1 Tax=Streptomyces sp. NBC_01255 TaxID=2903798 RepID=UPI002E2FBA49|nr:VCBS repeat-containing protein [Streptomyces sp. NBC_01255]